MDKENQVRNYIFDKLRENRILLDDSDIEYMVRIYSCRIGWKKYVDRCIKSLRNARNMNLGLEVTAND